MIAVNWSICIMPRLDTENVEPVNSSGLSLRSRAFFARTFASAEISLMRFCSALKITGTMSPSSVATAMPRCTLLK